MHRLLLSRSPAPKYSRLSDHIGRISCCEKVLQTMHHRAHESGILLRKVANTMPSSVLRRRQRCHTKRPKYVLPTTSPASALTHHKYVKETEFIFHVYINFFFLHFSSLPNVSVGVQPSTLTCEYLIDNLAFL